MSKTNDDQGGFPIPPDIQSGLEAVMASCDTITAATSPVDCEITDASKRIDAKIAIGWLWHAMDLGHSPIGVLGSSTRDQYEARYAAWRSIGELLLGDDCPDPEVLT